MQFKRNAVVLVKVGWWQPSPEAVSNINVLTMHLVAIGAKLVQAVRIVESVWRLTCLSHLACQFTHIRCIQVGHILFTTSEYMHFC